MRNDVKVCIFKGAALKQKRTRRVLTIRPIDTVEIQARDTEYSLSAMQGM